MRRGQGTGRPVPFHGCCEGSATASATALGRPDVEGHPDGRSARLFLSDSSYRRRLLTSSGSIIRCRTDRAKLVKARLPIERLTQPKRRQQQHAQRIPTPQGLPLPATHSAHTPWVRGLLTLRTRAIPQNQTDIACFYGIPPWHARLKPRFEGLEHVLASLKHLFRNPKRLFSNLEHLFASSKHMLEGLEHLFASSKHMLEGLEHRPETSEHMLKSANHSFKPLKQRLKGSLHPFKTTPPRSPMPLRTPPTRPAHIFGHSSKPYGSPRVHLIRPSPHRRGDKWLAAVIISHSTRVPRQRRAPFEAAFTKKRDS